ncbi:hypothetical protein EJV46_17785 [Roseococcus sp. SYP-B2431]|uniref:hypothetical protein n=1 Tax=Roseococcus sp. SYP-B2431 TaxID=2496640 RepID=UPI001038C681|nr:hypothetical protein [Roseococcus sp. SYP-B2431]TCH97164.1 hypothetical protein EJV46_17785 [Roseococcus sp. SYP-B2431]
MFEKRSQPPSTFEVAATMAAIESLHGTLSMARALVVTGRAIDLAGLDREAARLCAAVACLPGDSGRALLDPLQTLTREVDLLTGCMPRP